MPQRLQWRRVLCQVINRLIISTYNLLFFSVMCSVFVPWVYVGGGVALLYASKVLEKLKGNNFDQKIGIQVIQNALKVI